MPERTSILGGEAGQRGILGGAGGPLGRRDKIVAAIVGFFAYKVIDGIPGMIVGLLMGCGVLLLTRELPFGKSAAQIIGEQGRWAIRRSKGRFDFAPLVYEQPPEPAKDAPPRVGPPAAPKPVRMLPDGVGRIRMLSYAHPAGGELAVLLHSNPGEADYLSAVMEIEGQPSGLTREEDIWDSAEAFGRMLATCAGPTSLVQEIQLLTRIVPIDPAAHEWYILNNHAKDVPRELLESYAGLLGEARLTLEQHRNYIVARIPLGFAFNEAQRDMGMQGSLDETRCMLVDQEMNRLASLASAARLHPIRLLGPRRLAALLRSLQDPDFFIDDIRDADFTTCWQPTRATRRHLLTNDKWATRMGYVPPDSVTLEPVSMRWLSPLLIGVQPSVIRTLSVNLRLEAAPRARREAKRDAAEDRGKLLSNREGGRVTDGSDLSQATASMRRLDDLRPGSGHSGVRWGMCLAITASEKTLRRASDLIMDKAGECGLSSLKWFDGAHDLAQPFVWPLARGLKR